MTASDPKLVGELGPVATSVVFHGLPGAPHPPADAASWERELPQLVAEGLAGSALVTIERDAAGLERIVSVLRDAHRAEITMSRIAEAFVPEVLTHLDREGIPAVLVKGPTVARYYPQPRLRPFEDIDVLVPPGSFGRAMSSLERAGFTGPLTPRGFFMTRCREGVNLARPDGASIDLHHRIAPWVFAERLTFERVADAGEPLLLHGSVVPAASAVHNLMITALQIIGHRATVAQKLKAWRDVHELSARADPAETVAEARALGLAWFLAIVMRQLPAYARRPELVRMLAEERPSRAKLARLRLLTPPNIGSKSYSIGRLLRLPPANGFAYLVAKTVPSGRFLRGVYGSRWAYLKWWRSAQEHVLDAVIPGAEARSRAVPADTAEADPLSS